MKKLPVTYTGSSTENLYVRGIRNGKEIKLKVKDIGCCGPISVENPSSTHQIFQSLSELEAAMRANELEDGSIYVVLGEQPELYLFYNNNLLVISSGASKPQEPDHLLGKASFDTLEELNEFENKAENTIYSVTDKGTMEQYVYEEGRLKQISGAINIIVNGDILNETEIPNQEDNYDSISVLDYNLSELVNGDFHYKNWPNLIEVISDMPNLKSGIQMFYGCPLQSFSGALSSLTNGSGMFQKNCALDKVSIIMIIDSLPTHKDGQEHIIDIGYNVNDSDINQEELNDFKNELLTKGWTVNWHPNDISEVK